MSLPVASASTVLVVLAFCLFYATARIDVLNAWVASFSSRRNAHRPRHAYRGPVLSATAYRPDVERRRRALAVKPETVALRVIGA